MQKTAFRFVSNMPLQVNNTAGTSHFGYINKRQGYRKLLFLQPCRHCLTVMPTSRVDVYNPRACHILGTPADMSVDVNVARAGYCTFSLVYTGVAKVDVAAS